MGRGGRSRCTPRMPPAGSGQEGPPSLPGSHGGPCAQGPRHPAGAPWGGPSGPAPGPRGCAPGHRPRPRR
eukprot:5162380-Alexandrium_andersonii.AAC.1